MGFTRWAVSGGAGEICRAKDLGAGKRYCSLTYSHLIPTHSLTATLILKLILNLIHSGSFSHIQTHSHT